MFIKFNGYTKYPNDGTLTENSPFWNMENVIVAAHCADNTADQLKYSLEILENNLMLYCEGGSKDLMNVVGLIVPINCNG